MSDTAENTEEKQQLPPFDKETMDWVVKVLARQPLRMAVESFLKRFPEYKDEIYGELDEIRKVIYKRFANAKSDKDRPACSRIQSIREADEDEFFDEFPLANPRVMLEELHELYYFPDEMTTKRVRVLMIIQELVRGLRSPEGAPAAQSSGYGGASAEFEKTPIGNAHANVHENSLSQSGQVSET